ncbi:hypothetical protein BDV96DRAFT_600711 [Lophiotrema nucula]|uniref:BTB domain-containing protein n=1 Tax=Lophiotrema nucula TaxID=690887 RepID=A0A6A5Z3H4_9PLEO|nr:hypothetical protein BDV96DRAFT_600711 [Lophiotrema nucula]
MANLPEDVEIILAHDRKYKFHAAQLARGSTFFSDMLSAQNAKRLGKKAEFAGINTKWVVKLTERDTDRNPAGKLELLELDDMGKPMHGTGRGMVLNENGRIPTQLFDNYERVLYALYGNGISYPEGDMQSVLIRSVGAIQIAEYLGCVHTIGKPVEVALVRYGQDLFKHIQAQPWNWAQMACRIESELIFQEAIIHLAGNWTLYSHDEDVLDTISDQIRTLCEKHHNILNDKRQKLELAVMSQYPGDLATPSQERPIRREEFSKDILVWMALCFFRHYLGQRIILKKGGLSPDGGYELYKALGTAGDAYMDKSVLNQLHAKFPVTKKAMNVVENHLLEIKECIKGIVDAHGIMKNESQLITPVAYLTCVEVEREDCPWVGVDDAEGGGVPLGGGRNGGRMWGNDIIKKNLSASRRLAAGAGGEEESPTRKRARNV